ncbi:MAG: hypothetical protein AAB268_00115, partial [Elusimicrobiota bacterium]
KVLDALPSEDVVLTRRGKPAAAIIHLDEDLLDSFILAHHPTMIGEVEAARAEYRRKGGIDHATMKERIGRRRG